jgi:hypothetical protein
MDHQRLYRDYRQSLEDFWSRRANQTRYTYRTHVFGHPIDLSTNHPGVPQALALSKELFTHSARTKKPEFRIQIVQHEPPQNPGPPPDDLFDVINYAGEAHWLNLQLASWGNCFIDLEAGAATAVLSRSLCERPQLLSRCLLNTVLNNFFIGSGYGMLHASCLIKPGRALLLMAPHGSGKSTTAMHLVQAGFQLLSDSMVYLDVVDENLQLNGFPVGRIKLRSDMLSRFPELRPYMTSEAVRDETKYVVDLRQFNPALVSQEAIYLQSADLCLLTASQERATFLKPASQAEVWADVMQNSLYYDTEAIWVRNLANIEGLLSRTRFHHLTVGTDAGGIIAAVQTLWS